MKTTSNQTNVVFRLRRLFSTVCHLSYGQWYYRVVRRGNRIFMRRFPKLSHTRIARIADGLPSPSLSGSEIFAISNHALYLQGKTHDCPTEAICGRFHLLNRTIDFGSIAEVDWRRDLGEANNPLWRMNLAYMGYAVPLLRGGDRKGFVTIMRLLESLELQNDWSIPGVFRDAWFPYAVSHRLINLLCGLSLYLRAEGKADSQEIATILWHIRFCAAFIAKNLEKELQYNHLLKNYVALAVYSAAAGQVPRTFGKLQDKLVASIRQQILPDGGHAERSPMYHALCIIDLRIVLSSGVLSGENMKVVSDFLSAMEQALGVMTFPDKEIALFNDAWIGESPTAAELASDANEEKCRLPITGYVKLRKNDDCVIFDCGPVGPDENPGHAHGDMLSCEATIRGKRFLVDMGVPTYTAGDLRDMSRSVHSHNGPTLYGVEPIEFWGSFRVGRRCEAWEIQESRFEGLAPLWCMGAHNGYRKLGVSVYRYIGLWPGISLLITDVWLDVSSEAIPEVGFLISSDWKPSASDNVAFVFSGTKIHGRMVEGELTTTRQMPHWKRFGVEEKGTWLQVKPKSIERRCYISAVSFEWGKMDNELRETYHKLPTKVFDRIVG